MGCTLTALAGLAGAAVPAVAATNTGTVLQMNRPAHTMRVVSGHQAHGYRLRGTIPAGVRVGSRISFHAGRGTATRIVARGHARTITVRGVVVRRHRRLAIRLADGRFFGHASGHGRDGGGVAISLAGLQDGELVEIDVTLRRHGVSGATVRPASDDGCGGCGSRLDVNGVVVSVDPEAGEFSVDPGGDGDIVSFEATPAQLAALSEGDCVHVAGVSAADGSASATTIDASTACNDSADDTEVQGTITAIAPLGGAFTLTTGDGESLALGSDDGVLDGITLGSAVDVYYYRGDDGSLVADEVDLVADES